MMTATAPCHVEPSSGHAGNTAPVERNRLLAALPAAEYAMLAPHLEAVELAPQQVLAWPDEPIPYVYFERDGLGSIVVPMEDGRSPNGAIIGNEGILGLQAFLGEGVAREELVQITAGQAVRVRIAAFRELVRQCDTLQILIGRYTLALLTDIARSAGCNRVHSVEQRLARTLSLMFERAGQKASLGVTHDVLAGMLGARRASVTNAASKLAGAGLIDYRRGQLTVTDRTGLAFAACEDYRHSHDAVARMFGSDAVSGIRLQARHGPLDLTLSTAAYNSAARGGPPPRPSQARGSGLAAIVR